MTFFSEIVRKPATGALCVTTASAVKPIARRQSPATGGSLRPALDPTVAVLRVRSVSVSPPPSHFYRECCWTPGGGWKAGAFPAQRCNTAVPSPSQLWDVVDRIAVVAIQEQLNQDVMQQADVATQLEVPCVLLRDGEVDMVE